MEQFSTDGRPRRREHSKAFKTQAVTQCEKSGASFVGVALAHGLQSNMVHRWIREARQDQAFTHSASQGQPAAFVALPLPVSTALEQPGAAFQSKPAFSAFRVAAALVVQPSLRKMFSK